MLIKWRENHASHSDRVTRLNLATGVRAGDRDKVVGNLEVMVAALGITTNCCLTIEFLRIPRATAVAFEFSL